MADRQKPKPTPQTAKDAPVKDRSTHVTKAAKPGAPTIPQQANPLKNNKTGAPPVLSRSNVLQTVKDALASDKPTTPKTDLDAHASPPAPTTSTSTQEEPLEQCTSPSTTSNTFSGPVPRRSMFVTTANGEHIQAVIKEPAQDGLADIKAILPTEETPLTAAEAVDHGAIECIPGPNRESADKKADEIPPVQDELASNPCTEQESQIESESQPPVQAISPVAEPTSALEQPLEEPEVPVSVHERIVDPSAAPKKSSKKTEPPAKVLEHPANPGLLGQLSDRCKAFARVFGGVKNPSPALEKPAFEPLVVEKPLIVDRAAETVTQEQSNLSDAFLSHVSSLDGVQEQQEEQSASEPPKTETPVPSAAPESTNSASPESPSVQLQPHHFVQLPHWDSSKIQVPAWLHLAPNSHNKSTGVPSPGEEPKVVPLVGPTVVPNPETHHNIYDTFNRYRPQMPIQRDLKSLLSLVLSISPPPLPSKETLMRSIPSKETLMQQLPSKQTLRRPLPSKETLRQTSLPIQTSFQRMLVWLPIIIMRLRTTLTWLLRELMWLLRILGWYLSIMWSRKLKPLLNQMLSLSQTSVQRSLKSAQSLVSSQRPLLNQISSLSQTSVQRILKSAQSLASYQRPLLNQMLALGQTSVQRSLQSFRSLMPALRPRPALKLIEEPEVPPSLDVKVVSGPEIIPEPEVVPEVFPEPEVIPETQPQPEVGPEPEVGGRLERLEQALELLLTQRDVSPDPEPEAISEPLVSKPEPEMIVTEPEVVPAAPKANFYREPEPDVYTVAERQPLTEQIVRRLYPAILRHDMLTFEQMDYPERHKHHSSRIKTYARSVSLEPCHLH
jgi:hypothetical protein